MNNQKMQKLLNSEHTYYAHRTDSNSKELLSDHLKLTYRYYEKMKKTKNLETITKSIIKETFSVEDKLTEFIYNMFEEAIYYHDIGKINPLFQKNKMDNDLKIKTEVIDDTHAALSARIYIDSEMSEIQKYEEKNILPKKEKIIIRYVAYYFGYVISRHHSDLEDLIHFERAIQNKNIPNCFKGQDMLYEKQLDRIGDATKEMMPDAISLYILCKLLYSVLITADFYATYEYMTGHEINIEDCKNSKLFDKYEESELMKHIRKYEEGKEEIEGINKLRSDIFLETEKNLLENLNNDIFYIEAPTGAGKTNMAINLAKHIYQKSDNIKAINYIFPFNNIIEQTASVFDEYFINGKDYIVDNSTTSITTEKSEQIDYEAEYLKVAFRQYPITITSHVNLFDTLFGTGKEANYGLYSLIGSVIVIDEIQTYSNEIWKEIIYMFSKYSKLLNIKFIIMSATLPRLDYLLNENVASFCSLVQNTNKYYENPIFKDRVKLNFDLLNKKISIEELINEVLKNKGKKMLVECITKKTADELYSRIAEITDNVYELTGDDNIINRKRVIEITKQKNEIILIATQTIEAGVDIDMDIGYKDISVLDSEEQFIGRINRSAKKKDCEAYFFDLDDSKLVYKSDNRLEYNLKNDQVKELLINKNFKQYYKLIMDKIEKKSQKYDNGNIRNFYNDCKMLNFREVRNKLKLIKTNNIQLVLNYTIKLPNEEIKGSDVWNEFKTICTDNTLGFAERKIKLSAIMEKLNLFIYTICKNSDTIIEGERFGNMYYIENGERYMINGRFNRKKYLENGDELFI